MLKFYPTTKSIFSGPFDMLDNFESFFHPSERNTSKRTAHLTTSPRANIYKHDNGYRVELAVPGYSRENFEMSVEDSMLTITGKNDLNHENKNIHYQEWQYNEFKRSWSLPENTNVEGITARYEAGILHVDVPTMDKKGHRKFISVE